MLGRILRAYRLRSGFKAADVADSLGIRPESLSRIEADDQSIGISTLLALTALIKIPPSEWVGPWLDRETRLRPLMEVARHLIDQNDVQNARHVLRKVRSITHARRHQNYGGEVYRQWGRLTYKTGEYGRARRWLRRAKRAAARAAIPFERAIASYNYALALRKTHFIAESLANFDHAIAVFHEGNHLRHAGFARLSRANLLIQVGSYREALSEYRKAAHVLRGDPWRFDCILGEVICVWQVNSAAAALSLLLPIENLAADAERRARFHHNLGVLHRQLGTLDSALTHLSRALESKSGDVSSTTATMAEVCLCRTLAGERAEAVRSLSRFEGIQGEKDPRDVWAMAALSSVLLGVRLQEPLPQTLQDDHERRLAAAFSLLLSPQRE